MNWVKTNSLKIEIIGKKKDIKGKSNFYPIASRGTFIETFHELVQDDLEQIATMEKNNSKKKNNPQYGPGFLSHKEQQALAGLKSNQELVIRSADKGGGIVLQDYQDYHSEAIKILSDTTYYQEVDSDPFRQVQLSLK